MIKVEIVLLGLASSQQLYRQWQQSRLFYHFLIFIDFIFVLYFLFYIFERTDFLRGFRFHYVLFPSGFHK